MAGLTLEQLQEMGAKPKGITGAFQSTIPLAPTIKQPTFAERVGEDVAKRRETLEAGLTAEAQGKQTTGESILQNIGQGAGLLFDIGGEALKSVVNKIPIAIKKPIEQVAKSVLDTPLGQAGLKAISQGIDVYKEWKAGNPRTARDLESVVNIGMLFPVGGGTKIAGKEVLSTTGELAGKAATGLEKGLAKQTFEEALDIIKPTLTKAEKQEALEAGRGIVANKILPRKFEKISVIPTAQEKEMANIVKEVVSKSKNPIDNIEAISNEIAKQEGIKAGAIAGNDTIFNNTQLRAVLNKAKEESQIVFGSDKTLQNSYNSVVDEMMRQANKETMNLSGLLQARKNFDKIIEQKFPGLLSNPIGDSAKQNAVRDVRRAVNQFIADKLPEGNEFKNALKNQNLMYDAIENISKKTASAVDASIVQKAMKALRQNPLVAGVTGGILTYGALMGMFNNPVVIGTLVLGGTFKLGKAIITSKTLRESLVSVLRFLEKAGKIADANAIDKMILQLPKNSIPIIPK
jgi:hypothetical protein